MPIQITNRTKLAVVCILFSEVRFRFLTYAFFSHIHSHHTPKKPTGIKMDKALVHRCIFNWSLCKVRSDAGTEYRQELVHTLSRICFSKFHVEELFKLALIEKDPSVLMTMAASTFLHFELSKNGERFLEEMLRHTSIDHRLCAVELTYGLLRHKRLSPEVLAGLDGPIAGILRAQISREDTHVISRYFLERGTSTSERLDVSSLLPAAGLDWASAVEYLFSEHVLCDTTLTVDVLAPLPSEYALHHLVGLLPELVQQAFLRFVIFEKIHGNTLLTILRVVLQCDKSDRSEMVPYLLHTMENLDHRTSSEDRYLLWDVSWEILGKVPAPTLVKYLDPLWDLIGRLPEFTLSWSKCRIKKMFTNIYRDFPHAFFGIDTSGTCTVEILPDLFVENHMDTLVQTLECGIHHHPPQCLDLARIKLINKMNLYQLKMHHAFVEKHLHVLIRGLGDPEIIVRVAFRNVLPDVPDIYFTALVPFLESIVTTGDQAGMMILTRCSSSRLRVLRDPIIHRVLTLGDLGEDLILASPALLLFERLPDDILVGIVDRLVFSKDADTAATLFILKHMPGHLFTTKHMETLAVHLSDERPKVRDLFVDVLLKSKNAEACTILAPKCAELLLYTSRKNLQHKMIQILLFVDSPVLSDIVYPMKDKIHPRHLCILLRKVDPKNLEQFSDNILNICDQNMYLDQAVYLLGRLSLGSLWIHRDRILGLMQRRVNDDLSIDGALHVLQLYGNAGVELGHELIRELQYRETMYT